MAINHYGLLLLFLLAVVASSRSRSAAPYNLPREFQHTTTAEVPDRGQVGRSAAQRTRLVETQPRAQARIGGPFLIPDDDGDAGGDAGDLRPVSVSDVEAVAAGLDTQESESYTGETREREGAIYSPRFLLNTFPNTCSNSCYGISLCHSI